MYRVMGNIRHKDRNHLELIKQIIWQDIRRKEQRKGLISVRKKNFCKSKILRKFDFATCLQAIMPYDKYGAIRDR